MVVLLYWTGTEAIGLSNSDSVLASPLIQLAQEFITLMNQCAVVRGCLIRASILSHDMGNGLFHDHVL